MATTSFIDAVSQSSAAWAQDVDTATYSSLTGVAGTNTITAGGPKSFSLAVGQRFVFIPAATNTGTTTLNITPSGGVATGAKNVFCGGAACVGGEIFVGIPCLVVYDGTQFNILGPYVGGLVASGQIKFPATQNASSDVNTFDDYEEGTWTPGLRIGGSSAGITYGGQTGAYTKIGRLVTCHARILLSSKGGLTGTVVITGLPFTAANSNIIDSSGGPVIKWSVMTNGYIYMSAQVNQADTTANILGSQGAITTLTAVQGTDVSDTTSFYVLMTYYSA